MPRFTIDQILEVMKTPENIRNISVIAHVDHGKTTLTDSLVAKAELIATQRAGDYNFTHLRPDEIERGITIKSTGITLHYEFNSGNDKKQPVLINLIDSPGHVDFSSEVTAALRVTDGALVVVDFIEGARIQTETVLRQALQERVKPVLMINKVDRGIFEQNLDSEEIYIKFIKIIEDVNGTIATYQMEGMPEAQLDPVKGNIAFGSAYHGWAFTIPQFAKMYAKRFNVSEEKLVNKFWGDNYFDSVTNKWYTTPYLEGRDKPLKRAFCKFIMDPIIKLSHALRNNNEEEYMKIFKSLNIKFTKEEKQGSEKELIRKGFQKWIMAADALLEMIVLHLPSPKVAQKYRCEHLYEGAQDDECARAIKECDPKGPLMVYISKIVPAHKGRFYSFGRIFSGTISTGQKVRIMGPNYDGETKTDLFIADVSSTVIFIGKHTEQVPFVPCGNIVGLVGIDKYLVKTGTLSTHPKASTLKAMKYSVSPVVRVAVSPKNPADLMKLAEGLKLMVKTDPLVQVTKEETGEYIVAGCGELHLEICLKDLAENYARAEVVRSEPVVSYKETVLEKGKECLAKSANKLNRIFCQAEPLSEDLITEIELERLGPKKEAKAIVRTLVDKFGWDTTEAKKLWVFGPDDKGPNLLVDTTKGAQYLNETRDGFQNAFQWVSKQGVLADEEMRGVRVNILDVKIHPDPIQRGGGQIIPMAKRAYYAAQYVSTPRLQEPYYKFSITSPNSTLGGVYTFVAQRRGVVINEEPMIGTPLSVVTAYLPVADSFGFMEHLRGATSGQAFAQCVFDHWEVIKQDPFDPSSKVAAILTKIRKRKGLPENIPSLDNYLDKL